MRGVLALAAAAALLDTTAGSGQLPGTVRPAEALLSERPRIEVSPAAALLGGNLREQSVGLGLWWPRSPDEPGLSLGLVGGLLRSGRGRYSHSGAQARITGRLPGVEVSGGVGAGVGQGEGARGVVTVELGAVAGSLELQVRSAWLQQPSPDTASRPGFLPSATPVPDHRMEAELLARRSLGPLQILLRSGALLGEARDGPSRWLSGEAALPLGSPLELVVAGGSRPRRWESGRQGGRFAQVSLRLSLGPAAGGAARPAPEPAREGPLEASRLGSAHYLLRVRMPGAARVELRGDLTDWRVLALEPGGGGAWTLEIEKPAGMYHVSIRVDGGAWEVPPGLIAVPDGFGSFSGLLALPAEEEGEDGSE